MGRNDGRSLVNVRPVFGSRLSQRSAPATLVQKRLRELGIYVLPGTYFYWSSPERGEDYLRIALARDPELFAEACRALSDAVRAGNVLS